MTGNKNKAKRLQYLLTHSFYAKAYTVKKVTSNKGKGTSINKKLWSTSAAKMKAVLALTDKHYILQKESSSYNHCLSLEMVKKCLSRMSGKLSHTVLGRGKGSNPFSLVDFTFRNFTEFCEKNHVQQSMSHAGRPYDNAPMECFYNTLKDEYFNLRNFKDVESLNNGIY